MPEIVLDIPNCTGCPHCSRSKAIKQGSAVTVLTCYKVNPGKRTFMGQYLEHATVPEWCPVLLREGESKKEDEVAPLTMRKS